MRACASRAQRAFWPSCVTTFAVTKEERGAGEFGIPRFTIHRYIGTLVHTGFQRESERTQGRRKEDTHRVSLAVGNRRSGVCRLAGSWIFPVCLSVRPSVRSFVRSFVRSVRLADWLGGWLAGWMAGWLAG